MNGVQNLRSGYEMRDVSESIKGGRLFVGRWRLAVGGRCFAFCVKR
jgi:hypothetical protein